MRKNKFIFIFFAITILTIAFCRDVSAQITNILMDPALDIARFSPYKIKADISGSPTSASVEVSAINWDDPNGPWDYYADGTPDSQARTRTMSYDSGEGKWISQNIYPDDIYPEIFFTSSTITWNNVPSIINLRRNNYHLLHFDNPFTMAGNMNFFVEINAEPVSTVNSADLAVYLVRKNKDISFFNSDWRNDVDDVELIGTIGKDRVFHHNHVTGKSSHHLIPLTANMDGTVGMKNLDISGDFWIVLYSTSPNVNRGWNLKYHAPSVCDNTNRWYRGDQSGWKTTAQSGCPDSHIHIARRGTTSDGSKAIVTANYLDSDSVLSTEEFYFEPLPNLPPVATNFTSPIPGGNYGENINISWNPASDPNDDSLTYTITLLDSTGNEIGPLVSNASGTSFAWDVSSINNGEYGLKGQICDDDASPLCTNFYLASNFFISKSEPIYSLSEISISSNNKSDDSLAGDGDTVELSFVSSNESIENISVQMYSGGYEVTNPVSISKQGTIWTASYVVSANDYEGTVSFVISADNLDLQYSETTDISNVVVFREEKTQEEEEEVNGEDEDNNLEQQSKPSISSWKAGFYEDLKSKLCVKKVRLEIRGKRFDKKAKVRIGGNKPFKTDRRSSRKIIASFCYDKLLQDKTNPNKTITIINPGVESEKADKKINIKKIKKSFKKDDFNMQTSEGVRNIQTVLSNLGYLDSQYVTGFYGNMTINAIRKFQADYGIMQTGFVGPTTKVKLAEKAG